MNRSLRLAVFDVDGTLIDSQHNIVAAMTSACLANGLEAPQPAAIRRIIGLSLLEACARLLPDADEPRQRSVARAYKDAFFTLRQDPRHHEPLFPGTAEVLDSLEAEGWLLGIATGKTRRGLAGMLERNGFEGRFVTLQTADDHPSKPHPAMLQAALAETGTAAAQAVMIGDTTFDMMMGRSAGLHTVGVAWGYHPPEELRDSGADALVDRYAELPAVLSALLEGTLCA